MTAYRWLTASMIGVVLAVNCAARPNDDPSVTPVSAVLAVIDPATGHSRDLFRGDRQSFSRPLALRDTIYVASSNRTLYALDASNGAIRWQFPLSAPLFGLAGDHAIFVGAGATLYALDPATGKALWKYDGDDAMSDPALVDGAVVISMRDGPVALEQATGKLRWQMPVRWGYFVFSPLPDRRLCIWKPDDIFVIETERGKTLWQYTPDQGSKAPGALPTAAVADGELVCQLHGSPRDADDWSMVAREAGSGRVLWKAALGRHEFATGTTTLAGNTAYAILDDQLSAIDLTLGAIKWQATIKPLQVGGQRPVARNGLLFLPALEGDISALDEKTGKPKWLNPAPKPADDGQIRIGGISVTASGLYVTRNEQLRR